MYWTSDVSPYARRATGASPRRCARPASRRAPHGGNYFVDSSSRGRRAAGRTPSSRRSHRAWRRSTAAPVHRAPRASCRRCRRPATGAPAARRALGAAARAGADRAPGEPAGARGARARGCATASTGTPTAMTRCRGRHVGALAVPALGLPVGARVRGSARRRGGAGAAALTRQLAWRDFYAHVLLPIPATRAREFQERYRDGWSGPTTTSCSRPGSEGRTGYPLVDAGDAPARADRLDAQPRAAGRRLVPDQGPAHRLARGRAPLRRAAARRRARAEQRQLAVDRLDRRRPGAVLPAPVQPRRRSSASSTPTATYVRRWVPELRAVPPDAARRAVDDERRRAAGRRLRDRRATTRRRSSTTRRSAGVAMERYAAAGGR